jgi:hypothetical protein
VLDHISLDLDADWCKAAQQNPPEANRVPCDESINRANTTTSSDTARGPPKIPIPRVSSKSSKVRARCAPKSTIPIHATTASPASRTFVGVSWLREPDGTAGCDTGLIGPCQEKDYVRRARQRWKESRSILSLFSATRQLSNSYPIKQRARKIMPNSLPSATANLESFLTFPRTCFL